MVPLKYLSNFWRTLEMHLINCEISLQLKWSRKCIIVAGIANNPNPTFQINGTKLYVLVVTLSTQENIKLLEQLETGFKRTVNWNKCLAKTTNQAQNRYLDYLTGPSFQGVNRLFILSFKDANDRESHKQYYLPTMEINNNIMIDGRNFFDQPIKGHLKTYDNIRKIAMGEGDDYTTWCLSLFQKYFKLIAIDLSKQLKLDVDPKAIKQINFAENLDRAKGSTMFFIIETVLEQLKEQLKYYDCIFVLISLI